MAAVDPRERVASSAAPAPIAPAQSPINGATPATAPSVRWTPRGVPRDPERAAGPRRARAARPEAIAPAAAHRGEANAATVTGTVLTANPRAVAAIRAAAHRTPAVSDRGAPMGTVVADTRVAPPVVAAPMRTDAGGTRVAPPVGVDPAPRAVPPVGVADPAVGSVASRATGDVRTRAQVPEGVVTIADVPMIADAPTTTARTGHVIAVPAATDPARTHGPTVRSSPARPTASRGGNSIPRSSTSSAV